MNDLPPDAFGAPARPLPTDPDIVGPAVNIGGFTLLSRLLALARDTLFAWILGATALSAVFWAAFRIVTALRRLFGDNALSFGLTPFLRHAAEDQGLSHALRLTLRAAALAAGLAFIPAALCWIFPKAALTIFVPGAPGSTGAAGYLPAICLLYAPCAAALAILSALLHALRRFRRPAGAPVVFNLLLLAASGFACLASPEKAPYVCAWAVPIAGLAQLLYLLPALPRAAVPISRATQSPHSGPRSALALFPHMGQGLLSVAAPQIAGLACVALASTLEAGTAAVYFSERLVDLPLGLLGVGIGTALLPSLSSLHRNNDQAAFSATLLQGTRLGLFFGIPAGIGLAAVSPALVQTLLGHGKFTGADVNVASLALLGHAWAVPGLVLARCLAASCFARADAASRRSPGRAAVISTLAAILLAALLISPLGTLGLGLSLTLGAWLNAVLLLKPAQFAPRALARPLLQAIGRALLACAPAAWLCHFSSLPAAWALCAGLASGLIIYLALARAFNATEFFLLRGALRSLRRR